MACGVWRVACGVWRACAITRGAHVSTRSKTEAVSLCHTLQTVTKGMRHRVAVASATVSKRTCTCSFSARVAAWSGARMALASVLSLRGAAHIISI